MLAADMTKRPAMSAGRMLLLVAFGSLLAFQAVKVLVWLGDPNTPAIISGTDHAIYMRQAHRILDGGPWYQPFQVAGPYTADRLPELYPPVAVVLMLPFALLPDVVWWAIPILVTGWIVASYRPSLLGWTLILALLTYPFTEYGIVAGNPALWVMMFTALGTRYRWPAVFAVLKPTLAPFALIGIRSRWWWVGLGVLVVGSLVLWSQTLDWLTSVRNLQTADYLYLSAHIPLCLIPIMALRLRHAVDADRARGDVARGGLEAKRGRSGPGGRPLARPSAEDRLGAG